jgi:hypothetical protein
MLKFEVSELQIHRFLNVLTEEELKMRVITLYQFQEDDFDN